MALDRICSECPNSLAGMSAQAKTCSDRCRGIRSRRLRRNIREENAEMLLPEHTRMMNAIVRSEAPEIAHKLIADELRPVIREALTEDVLRAVHQLVGLTAPAIQAISEDLDSEDATIRQRAYTLVSKYTMGHPALLAAKDTDPNQQLVVHFNLPRPGGTQAVPLEIRDEPDAATELRECDECHEEKPTSLFADGSDRCVACFERMRRDVEAKFGDDV